VPVELTVRCSGCGVRKTFTAADVGLLKKMVAESRWLIDPARTECPRCYAEALRSYEAVAAGRSW
jgi:hypothetical protein